MNIRLLSLNAAILISVFSAQALTPTFKSACNERLTYAMALREWVVKSAAYDFIDNNMDDSLIIKVGPFNWTKKDLLKSCSECIINSLYASYVSGRDPNQTFKGSVLAEILYKCLVDLCKSAGLGKHISADSQRIMQKIGAVTLIKYFLSLGFVNAVGLKV